MTPKNPNPPTIGAGEASPFALDISFVEDTSELNDALQLTSDGCGSTCQSACSTSCPV